MPTSELTDALNPFIGQQRQPHYSSDHQQYPSQSFHTPPPQSSFTPHRSELEYAISEPPPPPRYRLVCKPLCHRYPHYRKCRPKVDAAHILQDLLRAVAVTREAQESENRRRLAWEQELEAKYRQRQAET